MTKDQSVSSPGRHKQQASMGPVRVPRRLVLSSPLHRLMIPPPPPALQGLACQPYQPCLRNSPHPLRIARKCRVAQPSPSCRECAGPYSHSTGGICPWHPSTPRQESPLQLSVLFPHIPAKMVAKIRSGAFVDMKGLLPDNIALQLQLESLQVAKPASKAKLREVKSIQTWLYCFLAYIAVATSDTRTREQLTYARLILRETLRTGGEGWAAYDRLFREHAALDKSKRMDWTSLDPGLHQATVHAPVMPKVVLAKTCPPDHFWQP